MPEARKQHLLQDGMVLEKKKEITHRCPVSRERSELLHSDTVNFTPPN